MDEKTNEGSLEGETWGYVVCFGVISTFVAGIGHVNSFGLIYNDFMANTQSTAKALTTAHGLFAIMLAMGGIILNLLKKTISLRTGGLIGAAVFIIGSLCNIFITNLNQLPITFGILQGIGFGLMVPVVYATFNRYFVKQRTTAMSICKAIQGILSGLYPQILKSAMSFYGFKGTLLLVCGISLHAIPGMLIMKTYHQNKPDAANKSIIALRNENAELLNNVENQERGKTIKLMDNKIKSSKFMSRCLNVVNLQVLRDPVYCNICIGQSFVNFSDLAFFMLQPLLLFQLNYTQVEVAACISIGAGADVTGRFILAIISSLTIINTRALFYVSTFFTFLVRLVILQVHEFLWMAILTGVLGILRAWLHISSPLVISNHVSHKDFPGAYAVFMLCSGVVNLSLEPLIGVIKDVTRDYILGFYTLTACCLPCILFWPMEYLLTRKNK